MLALGFFGAGGEADTVVAHVIKKITPGAGEGIGDFRGETPGEDAGILPFLDVLAAALDEVTGKLVTEAVLLGRRLVVAKARKLRSEQGEEVVESIVVAGVWGGGE